MDIISHGLWGGVTLGRKRGTDFLFAFALSLMPDAFGEGIMFLLILLGFDGMPSFEHGHPNMTDFPVYAQNFYNATHSLVVFIVIFAVIWILRKRPSWLLMAWAIHIMIDIPTHSFRLFPTPFLWPVSDFKIDGIPWDSSIIMIPNIILLALLYSFWLYESRAKGRLGKRN